MFNIVEGELYELRINGSSQGQRIDCITHWEATEVTGTVTSTGMLVEQEGLWAAEFAPLLHAEYRTLSLELLHLAGLQLDEDTNPYPYYDFADAIVSDGEGNDTNAGLPTYVSANIRKRTAGPATTVYLPNDPTVPEGNEKFFRGRASFGPLSESVTQTGAASNLLEDTFRQTVEDAWNAWSPFPYIPAGGESITFTMSVLSMIKRGAVRSVGGVQLVYAWQPVTAFVVPSEVGSQISRKQRAAA